MSTSARVFLSHASEDADLAHALGDAIRDAYGERISIFNAGETVLPGQQWKVVIEEAVKKTELVLAILTHKSVDRPWVHWECGGAYVCGIEIVPLLGPGVAFRELETMFPEFQAVRLDSEAELGQLAARLARLLPDAEAKQLDAKQLLHSIRPHLSARGPTGKDWLREAEPRIQDFLRDLPQGGSADLRLIGYTGETTASRLPAILSASQGELRVRILLRSPYHGFSTRPHHHDFNQQIRCRISRAKAMWCRWIRETDTLAELEIREYSFDPSLKALILGEAGGFFGQYALDHNHQLSDHPGIAPARDWVAGSTDMTYVDRFQSAFLQSQIRWFDRTWEQAIHRPNETYRLRRSDALWRSLMTKMGRDRSAARRLADWQYHVTEKRNRFGDLTIAAAHPETSEEGVDVIACGVIERRRERCALICEIRKPGDTWEGAAKTQAYLKLIGLDVRIDLGAGAIISGGRTRSDQLLRQIESSGVRARTRTGSRFVLFAADFVWMFADRGALKVAPPVGERAWGLWDVARSVLRNLASQRGYWEDGIQRKMHEVQERLLGLLQFSDLDDCYWKGQRLATPSLLVVVEPRSKPTTTKKIAEPSRRREVLRQVLQSGPNHPSPFWQQDAAVARRNVLADALLAELDDAQLPRVVLASGRSPFDSLPGIVRENI